MNDNYEILCHAILNKLQVICEYGGFPREMCPHVIGTKNDRQQILSYQFGGSGRQALKPEGQWRCMKVSEISGIETREGDWHTGDNHSQIQNCVDEIDVEVTFDIAAE